MFESFIASQLERVRSLPEAHMLSDKVFERLEVALKRKTEFVAGNTYNHMISSEVVDNPLGAKLPGLLTKEEREQALARVTQKLESGEMSLPGPLVECLTVILENTCDAFIEAVSRLVENRDEICRALSFEGPYQQIVDVMLSAGDTHNHGRSVMVFSTDVGKLVYKPHDLTVDKEVYGFAERFFPGFVGIPRAVAFGKDFGVCEFIEKRRAEGSDEAERFWYNLGGLTAFAKLFGSTDLHYQNILCHGTVPYLIDLETILSPVASIRAQYMELAETREGQMRTPATSLLTPAKVENLEVSVLMNTDATGIAPVVDGQVVTVRPYVSSFKKGYHDAYMRVVEDKEAVREALTSFAPDTEVRTVLRPTRGYWEILKKLYHYTAMESAEGRKKCIETLEKLLRDIDVHMDQAIVDSEVEQMRRSEVPYFYTYAGSLSLFGNRRCLDEDMYSLSAIDHALDNLAAMGEADLAFDLAYIDRAIGYYPEDEKTKPNPGLRPKRHDHADAPLDTDVAAQEAKAIFDQMHSMGIQAPNGRLLWGYVGNVSHSFQFGSAGLFDGLTGLAVFAAAVASVWPNDSVRSRADVLIRETASEILGLCKQVEHYEDLSGIPVAVGESSGFGGVLGGLALMRRVLPDAELDALTERTLTLVDTIDYSSCTEPDRITGLAGLISVLCRFEEYRGHTAAIEQAANRLVELKTLAYKDHMLWKTMHRVPRALTGAGHGMSGIAEALYAAADVLGNDAYLGAANDALSYEIDA